MANFTPPIVETDIILDQANHQFNTELQKMLDTVAPKKTIKQINKQKNPWLNKIHQATKENSQKRDRVWRRYEQGHQWHAHKKERNIYHRLLKYHLRQILTKQVRTTKTIKKASSTWSTESPTLRWRIPCHQTKVLKN